MAEAVPHFVGANGAFHTSLGQRPREWVTKHP